MNEAEGNTPQANLRKRKLCVLHQTSAPFATFWVIFVVMVLLVRHKIEANPWSLGCVYAEPHVLLEVWGAGFWCNGVSTRSFEQEQLNTR